MNFQHTKCTYENCNFLILTRKAAVQLVQFIFLKFATRKMQLATRKLTLPK